MTRSALAAVLLVTALLLAALYAPAAPPVAGADAFIENNCALCHNSPDAIGRFDLTKLPFEPDNPDNFALWVKVHDRVAAGEMPPTGMPRPEAASLSRFVDGLGTKLAEYERSVTEKQGRAGLRRLNSYEYENAIRDILSVPWVQIKGKLPQDGEAYRFNKIGTALDVSHVQLTRYMSTADYAMREAMASMLVQPAPKVTRVYARDEPSMRNFRPREGNTRTEWIENAQHFGEEIIAKVR